MKKCLSVMVLVHLTLFANCQEKYSKKQYVESSDVLAFPEDVPTIKVDKRTKNYKSETIHEVSETQFFFA